MYTVTNTATARIPSTNNCTMHCCSPVCEVAVPILEKELLGLSIPDVSGTAGTPIGKIDYSLKK